MLYKCVLSGLFGFVQMQFCGPTITSPVFCVFGSLLLRIIPAIQPPRYVSQHCPRLASCVCVVWWAHNTTRLTTKLIAHVQCLNIVCNVSEWYYIAVHMFCFLYITLWSGVVVILIIWKGVCSTPPPSATCTLGLKYHIFCGAVWSMERYTGWTGWKIGWSLLGWNKVGVPA